MKKVTGFLALFASLAVNFLMAAMFVVPIVSYANIDVNPLAVSGGITALSFAAQTVNVFGLGNTPMGGITFMAVQKEIWVDYILGNLFKDSSFTSKCFDESNNVLGGSVVHIPQAGAKPAVLKNNNVYPLVEVRRTDTDVTYPLDVYSTVPTHIPLAETMEISYDKIGSVLSEHVSGLDENLGDNIIYSWSPTLAAQFVRTSGAAVSTALAPGATGNRKQFVKADLRRAQAIMNKANTPKDNRYALIPTDMLSQLMEDPDLLKRDNQNEADLREGVVLRLYGFNIMERSSTTVYTNAATPVKKAVGAVSATSDNLAIICWHKNSVAKARGLVDFFENLRDARYQGDIYSALVKMGSRIRRANEEGVVAIIQEP